MHDTTLIVTITLGFGLALVLGLIAVRIGLPPIVGYLVAGIVVGPHSPGFVADAQIASQLADVGVVLLMFGVGLHFSLEDLLSVKRIAIPGTIAQLIAGTALGAGIAAALGWSLGTGLVFGLSLSVASTVVVLKALEQRGSLDSLDGRVAMGWLVVQDLVMVLALVLLPAFAPGSQPAGFGSVAAALAITLVKVAAFFAIMLLGGRRFIPWVLERVARTGSRELFTLSVLVTALGIAVGSAILFGVSVALGAFFGGVAINRSDLSYQAGSDALPLQDAFAVLFFVSVGMLFDPMVTLRQPFALALTLAIVLFAKTITAAGVLLWRGYRLRTSLVVSASLAQIGEFSFILAGLAVTLGILPDDARSLILSAALISIALNPAMFAIAAQVERWAIARPGVSESIERRRMHADISSEIPGVVRADHAIIVGYGRVGRTIAAALTAQKIEFIVIESSRAAVDLARKRGFDVIWGDASRPTILALAAPESARLLLVATPDPFQTRQILKLATEANPTLDTVVRTHSAYEQAHLEAHGVGRAVLGEKDTALAMSHYALVSLGLTVDQADAAVEWAREGVT